MKYKVQKLINILIIIFMPFMMYININETKVNAAASDILLVLVGILFLFNIKDFLIKKRWLYILYFIGLISSLILSQNISKFDDTFRHVGNSVMILEIVKTIMIAIYFFAAVILNKGERDYKISLAAVSLSSIPVIMIGGTSYAYFLMDKEFFIDIYKLDKLRFMGTFQDPNLCALFFIVVFFVSLLNFKIIKNIIIKFLTLGIGFISFIIILLTMSRGGWLALAGAVVIYLLLHVKSIIKKESVIIIFSVFIIIFISLSLDYSFQQGKITNYLIGRVQDSLGKDGNDIDRVKLMKAAFEMGNENFFFGVGKGSFPLNSFKYLPEDSSSQNIKSFIPHNTLLGFYSQQGILGLLVFITLPGYIFYAMIKYRRKQSLFLIPVFIGILIHSMTINIENTRFVWYILGLMISGEKMNINFNIVPTVKLNKRTFNTVLIMLLLIFMFFYIDVSRKLATNIYVFNGDSYDRKISVERSGDYQISFDIQTDSHLHSVEIFDGDKLIKNMEFKSAYGLVRVPVYLEGECKVVFKSNQEGWMRVNNAYFVQGDKKTPLYNYVLLPKFAEDCFNQKALLVYSEVPSFKKQIDVIDKEFTALKILDAKVIKYANLSHVYQFDIRCKQKVYSDYQLELLMDYNSISSLLTNEYQRNLWNHKFTLYPYTTDWRIGQLYNIIHTNLFNSDNFNLYGRYYDYKNSKYAQEHFFPIAFDLVKEKQDIIGLGESPWINIHYKKDKMGIINMNYNGWVESGRMNLQPGDYNITFKAQGSFLGEYSKVRVRDSELNNVAEISLDGNMKEYTVKYHVDEYKSGQSFILELINFEADKNGGNRQVLLKDWLKVDRKLG